MRAAALKGSVALVLQFDWGKSSGSLSRADLEAAVLPSLLTLAQRAGKAAQLSGLPVSESVSLVRSIIQARCPSLPTEGIGGSPDHSPLCSQAGSC